MNNRRRKSPSAQYPKKSRSVSFVGKEGYEILEFFDDKGSEFEYGKSGLIIELLKIYEEALDAYGKDAIFRMRANIRKDTEMRQ